MNKEHNANLMPESIAAELSLSALESWIRGQKMIRLKKTRFLSFSA
jgi:hypothetical protein